jgi:hypothetical protein
MPTDGATALHFSPRTASCRERLHTSAAVELFEPVAKRFFRDVADRSLFDCGRDLEFGAQLRADAQHGRPRTFVDGWLLRNHEASIGPNDMNATALYLLGPGARIQVDAAFLPLDATSALDHE